MEGGDDDVLSYNANIMLLQCIQGKKVVWGAGATTTKSARDKNSGSMKTRHQKQKKKKHLTNSDPRVVNDIPIEAQSH